VISVEQGVFSCTTFAQYAS